MQVCTAWEKVLLVGAEESSSVFVGEEPVQDEVDLLLRVSAVNVLVVELQIFYFFIEESL